VNCLRANSIWLLLGGILAHSGNYHPEHADGDLVATFSKHEINVSGAKPFTECPWIRNFFPFRYDGKHLTHVDGKQFVFAAGGYRILDGEEYVRRGGWGGSRGIYSHPHEVVLEGIGFLPKSILEVVKEGGGRLFWNSISEMPSGSKLQLHCEMAVEDDREKIFHASFTYSRTDFGFDYGTMTPSKNHK